MALSYDQVYAYIALVSFSIVPKNCDKVFPFYHFQESGKKFALLLGKS